jgi:NAD-dependent SIR2 family protein deacetylase
MSSKKLFHSSAYSDPQAAEQLHNVLLKTFESASKPEFTPFEVMMENLAKSGRIQRHYAQNIDCRTARLPSLAEKTVWLHGRLDKLRCHINPEHTKEVNPKLFPQWILQACPMCEETNEKRRADNKRPRSVGVFRTDVLLYDERSPHESEIEVAFDNDLKRPVDTIIIVGTRLEIDSLRAVVKDMCRSAERAKRDILTIWISKERQKYGRSLGFVLNYEYIGDCDEFASLLMEETRKS